MKKTLLLLVFLSLSHTTFAETPMVRLTRFQGQDISGVTASGGFKVELYQADETEAIVEIPAELEPNLEFHLGSDGSVTLGIKGTFTGKKKLPDCTAKIYVKDLRKVKSSGGSKVTFITPFTTTSVVIEASGGGEVVNLNIESRDRILFDVKGGGKITGEVKTKLLRSNVSGGAQLNIKSEDEISVWEVSGGGGATVSGNSGESTITASGGAGFRGSSYRIHSATLKSSGAGGIEVGEVQELSANASSAAKIRYSGNPNVKELKTSSAGSIQKK